MNKIRWLIFLLIGIPTQMLVYLIYPFLYAYYRLFVYKRPTTTILVNHDVPTDPFNCKDDHGTLCYYGTLNQSELTEFTKDNCFLRTRDGDMSQVSGDVVVSWCFAYTADSLLHKPKELVKKLAMNYLLNLGTPSFDTVNRMDVSNRCNNFGINYCPDSSFFGLGQPMAGPQFYTNSALFALASQTSLFFKVVFWLHWVLFGGWYWAFMPIIHPKNNGLFYVRDITMKALYVHKYVFGDKWWIRKPMEFITFKMSNFRNDLFYAMMGIKPVDNLPMSMDGFFSQREDCKSTQTDRMNPEYGAHIIILHDQAFRIQVKERQ